MKQATINNKWSLILPDVQADWEYLQHYEVKRLDSMERNLKRGDTVLDIGTEHGSISALIATWVGGEHMHLFEPTPNFWPNIRQTWIMNKLENPAVCFVGFVDYESDFLPWNLPTSGEWPLNSQGGEAPAGPYPSLLVDDNIPKISIDTYCRLTSTKPDVLNIDAEGAEARVLDGADITLRKYKPLIYLSIHPMYLSDYMSSPVKVLNILDSAGYRFKFLEEDHEVHYCCWHPEGRQPIWS